jgi:hypothetical protein
MLIASEKKNVADLLPKWAIEQLSDVSSVTKGKEEELPENLRSSVDPHSVVELCDDGISTQTYRALYKLGELHKVLPCPFTCSKQEKKKIRS